MPGYFDKAILSRGYFVGMSSCGRGILSLLLKSKFVDFSNRCQPQEVDRWTHPEESSMYFVIRVPV